MLQPGEAFIDFIAVSEKARYAAAQHTYNRPSMQDVRLCDLFLSNSHLPKHAGIYCQSTLAYSLCIQYKLGTCNHTVVVAVLPKPWDNCTCLHCPKLENLMLQLFHDY